jgi:hypothetical protein
MMKGLDDIKGLARSAFQSPAIKFGAVAVLAGILTTTQDAVAAGNGPKTSTFHKDLCVSEKTYDARIESGQYQEVLSYTVGPFTKKSVSGNIIRQEIREEFVINAEGDEWAKMQPQPKENNQHCVVYHGIEPDVVNIRRNPNNALDYDYGPFDDWDNKKLIERGIKVCQQLIQNNVLEECAGHNNTMNELFNESDDYGMAFRGVRLPEGGKQQLTSVTVHRNNKSAIVEHTHMQGYNVAEPTYVEFRYSDEIRQGADVFSFNMK